MVVDFMLFFKIKKRINLVNVYMYQNNVNYSSSNSCYCKIFSTTIQQPADKQLQLQSMQQSQNNRDEQISPQIIIDENENNQQPQPHEKSSLTFHSIQQNKLHYFALLLLIIELLLTIAVLVLFLIYGYVGFQNNQQDRVYFDGAGWCNDLYMTTKSQFINVKIQTSFVFICVEFAVVLANIIVGFLMLIRIKNFFNTTQDETDKKLKNLSAALNLLSSIGLLLCVIMYGTYMQFLVQGNRVDLQCRMGIVNNQINVLTILLGVKLVLYLAVWSVVLYRIWEMNKMMIIVEEDQQGSNPNFPQIYKLQSLPYENFTRKKTVSLVNSGYIASNALPHQEANFNQVKTQEYLLQLKNNQDKPNSKVHDSKVNAGSKVHDSKINGSKVQNSKVQNSKVNGSKVQSKKASFRHQESVQNVPKIQEDQQQDTNRRLMPLSEENEFLVFSPKDMIKDQPTTPIQPVKTTKQSKLLPVKSSLLKEQTLMLNSINNRQSQIQKLAVMAQEEKKKSVVKVEKVPEEKKKEEKPDETKQSGGKFLSVQRKGSQDVDKKTKADVRKNSFQQGKQPTKSEKALIPVSAKSRDIDSQKNISSPGKVSKKVENKSTPVLEKKKESPQKKTLPAVEVKKKESLQKKGVPVVEPKRKESPQKKVLPPVIAAKRKDSGSVKTIKITQEDNKSIDDARSITLKPSKKSIPKSISSPKLQKGKGDKKQPTIQKQISFGMPRQQNYK